jgi:hypothetical protein
MGTPVAWMNSAPLLSQIRALDRRWTDTASKVDTLVTSGEPTRSLSGRGGANVEHASDLNRPEQVRTAFNCTGAACAESVSAGQRSCRAELADKRSHTRLDRLIKALSCGKTGL